MTETWRPIPDYPGYEASDAGRIRSVERRVWNRGGRAPRWQRVKARVMDPSLIGQYPTVRPSIAGRKKTVTVHTLVALAFLGPKPLGKEVLHRDGNPHNNALSNLRWGTRAENMQDAVAHGTTTRGERSGTAKLTQVQVDQIRCRRANGDTLTVIASNFGVSAATVSNIARRKSWK